MINKLVEKAKLKIEHTKKLANTSPSNPAVRRKEGEGHDNKKESTGKKVSRSSPEHSKCTKTVVVGGKEKSIQECWRRQEEKEKN